MADYDFGAWHVPKHERQLNENIKSAFKCCYNLFESLANGKEQDSYYMQEFEKFGDFLEKLGIKFDD